ncbi:hypothetical protein [Streptomyces rhizosphaericus]|uniref:Uncharacterized protein n=1 Tax=Streptomyces rhizosphaericus TaxID=114699 RepID=A0A6G4AE46_9ACTN|nr:hypothetical protein [Streptomyces rhizosphaericus]NEW71488.1 hypothetical protein [Streptomyces rhizosphaericus]
MDGSLNGLHFVAIDGQGDHLPALGNRRNHKLMHEQCLSKRDATAVRAVEHVAAFTQGSSRQAGVRCD